MVSVTQSSPRGSTKAAEVTDHMIGSLQPLESISTIADPRSFLVFDLQQQDTAVGLGGGPGGVGVCDE